MKTGKTNLDSILDQHPPFILRINPMSTMKKRNLVRAMK